MEGVGTVIIILLLICILSLSLVQIFTREDVPKQEVTEQSQEESPQPRDYRFWTKPLNERYKWWGADVEYPLTTSSGYYDALNGMYYQGTQYLYGTDVESGGSNIASTSNAPVDYSSLVYSGRGTTSSSNATGFMNFDMAAYSPF